jgi:phosphoserine phosphatase
VFFDVDGTLVYDTSSSRHLARHLGHWAALSEAEDAYAAGIIDNREVSVLDAGGWQNASDAHVQRVLSDLPLVDGIAEVVAWCRQRGLSPLLATLAWEPVGRYLCDRFGFDGACGPMLERRDGVYTGVVERHFDEFDKREFAVRTAASRGLMLSSCAAVGDSRSDIPLFNQVGFAIAFNATPAAQAAATASVSGRDLCAIIPSLDDWLNRR